MWLVFAIHVIFLLVGSLAKPLLDVTDEKHHVDMLVVVGEGEGWPAVHGRELGAAASIGSELQRKTSHRVGKTSRDESTAIPRRTADSSAEPVCQGQGPPVCEYRPSFRELEEEYDGPFAVVNHMTQHPPLYYVITHSTAHGALAIVPLPGGVPFDLQILSYRWVSILLIAPLPVLIYLLAAMLTRSEAARRTATVFPLVLAGLEMRNGPMVNNDSLLLLLATLLTIVLVRTLVDGPTRWRTVAVGVLTGLALLAKGLALVFPGVVIIAFALRWRRHRDEGRTLLGDLVVAGLISLVLGGWWWLRNLLVYGQIQPTGRAGQVAAGAGFDPSFFDWLNHVYPALFRSFWGGHLWPADLGRWLPGVAVAVLLALVIVGIVASDHRDAMLMALSPIVLLALTVGAKSWDVCTFEGIPKNIAHGAQGRYAYAAIAAISVAFAIGLWRALERGHAGYLAVSITAVAAVAVELRSFYRLLVLHWGAFRANDLAESYAGFVAWSPLPPVVTSLVVVLFGVACVALVAGAVRESIAEFRAPSSAVPEPPPVTVGADG